MHMTAIDIGVLDAFSRPVKERLLEFILTHIFFNLLKGSNAPCWCQYGSPAIRYWNSAVVKFVRYI